MELTFGEKLVIARKQLDLYQYQMAERLGASQLHRNTSAARQAVLAVQRCSSCCAKRKASASTSTPPLKRGEKK
jgi:hypothetical protein